MHFKQVDKYEKAYNKVVEYEIIYFYFKTGHYISTKLQEILYLLIPTLSWLQVLAIW